MSDELTLTFLFTDIEGSTLLAQQFQVEMPSLLAQHHFILQQSIEAHHGVVFQIIGDAFCAAFQTVSDALYAGLEAQRRLRDAALGPATLRVRMGIHTGPARAGSTAHPSGGYSGYLTLARAQRVMSAAHGGQILVSDTSAALLSAELPRGDFPEEVDLRDLGMHQLKGLERFEHLWQVVAPDLMSDFPPVRSLEARSNNLPIQLTSFIGRQSELAQTVRSLAETRLLTLIGPGGTGKTRLAIQTAAEELERSTFPDGAWLVELAPISSSVHILPAIAGVLNVHQTAGRSIQAALADFLRSKTLLLILDNCEHLIETCAEIAGAFLQAGRGIKILASSREPLGIAGESIFRVPPLTLPAPDAMGEELFQNETVQLFVERARAVKPGFTLTAQNAPAVIQICRRLDGIPLAIELAAARVTLLSPAGIANRLDDRFRLLTGGSRTGLPRQQTLESLIDWSYDLLSPEEKNLFQTLAVFSGGFTYEAAEAVFRSNILDPLNQLVNKSLVLAEEVANEFDATEEETRYRMLETIRQYAGEKLLAAGKMESLRDRHMEYFAQFAKEAEVRNMQLKQLRSIKELESERDNLIAAIEWALKRKPETALQIIGKAYYWRLYSYASEGLRWLEEGIEEVSRQPEESVQGGEALRRKTILAEAYWGKYMLLSTMGRTPEVIAALKESIRLWREVGDSVELARSLSHLGFWGTFESIPNQNRNPYRAYAEEGLFLGREHHDADAIGQALAALGREALFVSGDHAAAKAYLTEAVEVMRQSGDLYFYAITLISLGFIANFSGDFQTARSKFSESLGIFQKFGDLTLANVARGGLAETMRLDKDFPQAVRLYLETLSAWQDMGNLGGVARCLECMAFIARAQAQTATGLEEQHSFLQRAGSLLGAAAALRESISSPMTHEERMEYDQELSALRSLPSQDIFTAAWQQGRAMNLDQAKAIGER